MAYDVAIIGGGLSGILTAIESANLGMKVVLIDDAIPEASGSLGGFAKFSGAKFSHLPAGQGLIPVAGGVRILEDITTYVLNLLGLSGIAASESSDLSVEGDGVSLRSYQSILLTPSQVADLVDRSEQALAGKVDLIKSRALNIFASGDFVVDLTDHAQVRARKVILATGRQGAKFALMIGAEEQDGRGIDVGVRLDFPLVEPLSGLRKLGPDAKILYENSRTFCLNVPGRIYRYPLAGFSIPGGVVAEPEHTNSNVGLLTRLARKKSVLPEIMSRLEKLPAESMAHNPYKCGCGLGDKFSYAVTAFGESVVHELTEFMRLLHSKDLIDFDSSHAIHFPLLDWHWPTFALPGSHRTTVRNFYVAGDVAGHARGLLQAGISGVLAAREASTE
ncbi:FAD-dependent oxidoreductase [Paracoccus denitrificans]|uniref:FAD-dependent oxidoreductase n=1 Tax=Paracoccus denitrificans TaxID=266 RepID=UPI001E4D8F23|nr:FAD-dependent oxidoreductase [Paracoccus denitrificans]UFS66258.1 FAD-dependent oxidoreductase [Paracoccus denitrificans]